uniref:Peptidase_M28 domain-containing protein n=1 Tax=Syphacia muris TaxID=451379 RepID=A0A0N5A7K4_9BILA
MIEGLLTKDLINVNLLTSFIPKNIRDNLRWLSSDVHVAGTVENNELMNQIYRRYKTYGYSVKTYEYTVLLSYPNYNYPNTIHCKIDTDKWIEISNGKSQKRGNAEAISQQSDPRSLVYWTAYSKNGSVEAPIVYVNYCTTDDFNHLSQINVSVKNKIVLCRYGKLFRGQLVYNAEYHGATFPNQIWLPDSGAQLGTLLRTDGDPETPMFPSKDYIYRTETEASVRSSGALPNIPVMPIGYRDALKIFQHFDGSDVQFRWQGGLNITYRYTGLATFRLSVRSTTMRRKVKNVIATMSGAVEPDRYVLLSNHVDAWVKGAIDPGTGTATMLEMARVLMSVAKKHKWRPRRSIVFCQWDAEEYGLIGSTEWVEEFMKPLQQRAVALINVDNISGNTTLLVKSVPLLYRAIVKATSKIPTPNPAERSAGRKTMLDSWKYHAATGTITGDKSIPRISVPGSGSDYQRFLTYLGIPIADFRFESVPLYSYMLYHSMYEIPWTVENLIDKDFTAMTAVGQLWLEMARSLADDLIIPFNPHDYAVIIQEYVEKLSTYTNSIRLASAFGANEYHKLFQNLRDASKRLIKAADYMQHIIHKIRDFCDKSVLHLTVDGHLASKNEVSLNKQQIEMLNSRLQNLERAFIAEDGIYLQRQNFRHVIFSNSASNKYGGVLMPGIMEPAEKWKIAKAKNNIDEAKRWLRICRIGFNKLQYAIESAILILNLDGTQFLINNSEKCSDSLRDIKHQ